MDATFSEPFTAGLTIKDDSAPFVENLNVEAHGKGVKFKLKDGSWPKATCKVVPCRVRYRFRLAKAAAAIQNPEAVGKANGLYMTTPSAWLVRPAEWPAKRLVELKVDVPAPAIFATGLPLGKDGAYLFDSEYFDDLSAAVFGPAHLVQLPIGGGMIDLVIAPGGYDASEPVIIDWIKRAANAVTAYFGRYPVQHVLIFVRPRGDRGGSGMTVGYGGDVILAPVEPKATAKELAADWMMTHEMVHLSLPSVRAIHHWLEEGLATYVEPIARLRTSELRPADVWRDIVIGMPQGQPKDGDEGLDHTATWGRTYWGGALFWLRADVEIRKRSNGRMGLENALQGILSAGGSVAERWDITDVLATADRAVAMDVLTKLYDQVKAKPVTENLAELWKDLGVILEDDNIRFDDAAPLAYVRRGITTGKGEKTP